MGGGLCAWPQFLVSLELGPLTVAGEAAKGPLMCPVEGRALSPGSAPAPRAEWPGEPLRDPGRRPRPVPDAGINVNPANPTPASEAPLDETPATTLNPGGLLLPLASSAPHPRWSTHVGAQVPRERKPSGWGLHTEMPLGPGPCPQRRTPARLPTLKAPENPMLYGVQSWCGAGPVGQGGAQLTEAETCFPPLSPPRRTSGVGCCVLWRKSGGQAKRAGGWMPWASGQSSLSLSVLLGKLTALTSRLPARPVS